MVIEKEIKGDDRTKFLLNISPRDYQAEIVEKCRDKNTLVVIPTGIGKTLIALMLVIDRMQKFPLEKILFLAPTRPLAEQHLKYFKKHLPELFAQMELFTGKVNAENRKKIWQRTDIIFSTPQCIANDLKNNLYRLDNVSLLIEDEAHRCMKNYSYTYVAKKYHEQAANPLILGLTASPGADKKTIKTICENLMIEGVEIRTRESNDVKEYIQELKFKTILVEFPEKFKEIKDNLNKIFERKVNELKNRKVLFGPANKITIINTQNKLMKSISAGTKNFNLFSAASACAQALKVQHAIELVETQTLYSLDNYLKSLFEQANKNQSKAVKNLVSQPEFNKAYTLTQELIAQKLEHPKLLQLKDIIEQKINKSKDKKIKIIVFTQYRDTATRISKELNSANIPSKIFVGQTKKGEGDKQSGLNQKEQQEIIKEFSSGGFNVMCATSVHPNEYIILKKGDEIKIKKIGEFVDSFLPESNKETISKPIGDWEALTSTGRNLTFKPITHVHKHPIKNKMISLKLNSGFDCFITENHSLFSFNENKKFVPAEPKKDKFIALALKAPNIENNQKIDVIKILSEVYPETKKLFCSLNNLTQAKIRMLKTNFDILSRLEKKRSITEMSKTSKRDYSTVKNCAKRLLESQCITQERERKNFKNLSKITENGKKYLEFLNWFFKNVKYKKGKYRFSMKSALDMPEYFNDFFEQDINVFYGKTKFPRFLEINESLARFLGFYVSEGSARKTKLTSDIFLAARKKQMQDLMKESIKNGLKLKLRVNKNGVAIDSQIGYYLIKDVFKAGIGAYNKEVPEVIFTAPSEIKWEFINAYFQGDGHLSKTKDKIVFTTVSRKLVIGIVLLLRMLGIRKITIYKQKHIFRINIYESMPFAKIKPQGNWGRAYYSLLPTAIESRKAFKIYKNYFARSNSYIKCRKNDLWKEDICYDFIKEIKEIKKPCFVYDLSVKDTENFIGGTGLFCFHNSIGEEGLDIPEVNAVIFYEPVPSAIRKIQRAGRTARLMPGEAIMLVTKGTRDESYYWSAYHKEKSMYKALDTIKKDLENGTFITSEDSKENETIISKEELNKEQKTLF